MGTNQTKRGKITWGASFANTLLLQFQGDGIISYSEPSEGSQWVVAESGVRDAWIVSTTYVLEFDWRWIYTTTGTYTGWDGATGVRAWLENARAMNVFRWYPDASSGTYIESYLREPMNGAPTVEPDGSRSLHCVFVNTSNSYDSY